MHAIQAAVPPEGTPLSFAISHCTHGALQVVVFKGGGYIYSDAVSLIESAGLDHVLRMTNLIRKANCVVACPRWTNGRRVNLQEHRAAAATRGVPFYVLERLELLPLLAALRPTFMQRRILAEPQLYARLQARRVARQARQRTQAAQEQQLLLPATALAAARPGSEAGEQEEAAGAQQRSCCEGHTWTEIKYASDGFGPGPPSPFVSGRAAPRKRPARPRALAG